MISFNIVHINYGKIVCEVIGRFTNSPLFTTDQITANDSLERNLSCQRMEQCVINVIPCPTKSACDTQENTQLLGSLPRWSICLKEREIYLVDTFVSQLSFSLIF